MPGWLRSVFQVNAGGRTGPAVAKAEALPIANRSRELIVHIGAAKCGSSAIQAYLARNCVRLTRLGVLVPAYDLAPEGGAPGNHAWEIERIAACPDVEAEFARLFTALRDHMDSRGIGRAIISAENISTRLSLVAPFVAAAKMAGFDVRVVYYVRRQDNYLISAWLQWGLKRYRDIQSFAETSAEPPPWTMLIKPWEEAVGSDRILLRPFERSHLQGGDVVTDFCAVLDLPADDEPVPQLVNRTYDEHLGALANRVGDLFENPHDNRFFDVMESLLGDKAFKSGSASHLLSLEERQAYVTLYEGDNRELRDTYLPDHPIPALFDPPTAESVIELSETDKLRAENALLIRAIYRLTERVMALEAANQARRRATFGQTDR